MKQTTIDITAWITAATFVGLILYALIASFVLSERYDNEINKLCVKHGYDKAVAGKTFKEKLYIQCEIEHLTDNEFIIENKWIEHNRY